MGPIDRVKHNSVSEPVIGHSSPEENYKMDNRLRIPLSSRRGPQNFQAQH